MKDSAIRSCGKHERRRGWLIPCVVSVYEVSEADGLIHIAMEFVEGETLHAWQSKEPITGGNSVDVHPSRSGFSTSRAIIYRVRDIAGKFSVAG